MRFSRSCTVVALMVASAAAVSAGASSRTSAMSVDERHLALGRIARLSKRHFDGKLNDDVQRQIDEIRDISLNQDESFLELLAAAGTACLGGLTAIADEIDTVVSTCGMAIEDLFDIGNIEDLIDLCGNENVEACIQAVQDAVAAAEPQFETCAAAVNELLDAAGADFDFEIPAAFYEISEALDGGVLQQAVCMAGEVAEDALDCADSLQSFVGSSTIDIVQCLGEFANQDAECSEECAAVAESFVDDVGCCATGLVYSLNIDDLLMRLNTTVGEIAEDLTVCGVELFGCAELETLFSDNQLGMIVLPAAEIETTEAPDGGESTEGNGETQGSSTDSVSAATVTTSLAIVACSVVASLL